MADHRLLIIDGYSLLFRAFYGTRYLSTSDGRPTNALYGFTAMLFQLVDKVKPDCILVALDSHKPTFRHVEYAEYKGTRKETPPELITQLIDSREFIAALGIPTIEVDGFEADDVVGTVSLHAEKNNYKTTIITGDLDQLQLVDECVTVVTPKQGVSEVSVYDLEGVNARYGFGPEFIVDYKALVGDTSDNIPGVPGVGEKTATKLILEFGHVENLIEKLDEVEEKFKKKLVPALEQIPKSKWLATIVRDVPLEFDFSPYRLSPEGLNAAQAFLEKLEMKSLARRVPNVLGRYTGEVGEETAPLVEVTATAIESKTIGKAGRLDHLVKWLDNRPAAIVVVPGAQQASMFGEDDGAMAYVAVGAEVMEAPMSMAMEAFRANPGQFIGHDLKSWYKSDGVSTLASPKMDSAIAAYVLNSDRSNYELRELIGSYLDAIPPDNPGTLATGLFYLEDVLRNKIEKEHQEKVLFEMEQPLIPILAEMEETGIKVDRGFLNGLSSTLGEAILEAQKEVYKHAGREFTIASPKQLGELMFEELQIPGGKKTKTGYATGVEILSEIDHPIAAAVLHWRELTKLKSTYTDALPRMILDDGRIHTRYNQTVAATGRLSSNEPNLQNIPIRTELGRQIRQAFIAEPPNTLLSLDYSQIELRLLAHLCEDPNLVKAFQDRVDVHTVTAAMIYHIDAADVTKEQRRVAKMLNYAVLYGVTDFGLAQQLGAGFGVSEARELIKQYNERFPTVKAYTESVVAEARSKGFTVTLTGRRRHFANIHGQNRNERMYAERQAMNAPIQGSAADMIKLAMIDVRKLLEGRKTKMLLQVHDELVFELAPGEEDLIPLIRTKMEDSMKVSVPIEVDAKIGANWQLMSPVG